MTLTEYDRQFLEDLEIKDDDIETDWNHESEWVEPNRTFSITIHHSFYDKEAILIKQRILDNQKVRKEAEGLLTYVRLLQDGDPENEDPKKILDYVESSLNKVLTKDEVT